MRNTKQQRIDELEKEAMEMRRYISDLRERQKVLVSELGELAAGIGQPAPWHTANTDHTNKMQYKAQKAISRVALMPLREGP